MMSNTSTAAVPTASLAISRMLLQSGIGIEASESQAPTRRPLFSGGDISQQPISASRGTAAIIESSMKTPFPEYDVFAAKAEAAWSVLQQQYADRLSSAEVDHLFACFVFGLTSPIYADREPRLHFEVCRALVAIKLPPERAEAALRAIPEPTQPWIENAYQLIENQGAKIGYALQETAPNLKDISADEARSTGSGRLGNSEDTAQ
jgi:hypothetical protein